MFKVLVLTTSVMLALFTVKAEAGEYHIPAAACVPDPGTTELGLAKGGAGTISFAPNMKGNIILYCPIPFDLAFSPGHLAFMWSMTGTTSGSNFLQAQYMKMNIQTGNTGTDALVSNQGLSSVPVQSLNIGITTAYLPANYAYYVRIDIVRDNLTTTPVLYWIGVSN